MQLASATQLEHLQQLFVIQLWLMARTGIQQTLLQSSCIMQRFVAFACLLFALM